MTQRASRAAIVWLLETCDALLNAAWSRVNPTHDEVLGRIDEIAGEHFDDGAIDETPTPSVVTASDDDPFGLRDVVTEDELPEPTVICTDSTVYVDTIGMRYLDAGRVAEFAWRMQAQRHLYAANGCEAVTRDGDTLDFVATESEDAS